MFMQLENDDSPVHNIACTQEANNDIDVVWDWNSPQAKQQPRRINKRFIPTKSPKIPLKRHPSSNQIQYFEKLHEELKNLKEAISVPDNEESLILSPVQEREYKDIKNFQDEELTLPPFENVSTQVDMFSDSMDDQLILATQRIEAELCNVEQVKDQSFYNNIPAINEDVKILPVKQSVKIDNVCFSNSHSIDQNIQMPNDSFDNILETFKTECNDFTTIFDKTIPKENIKGKHVFSRTKSENQNKVFRQTPGKVEFYRTESFESTLEHRKDIIPQSKLDEIERKRKEALAKLESKRKMQECSGSPIKCTPYEIEQKRLQALARREEKRQQEIIERKRKEALKRLELSRKKNATIVKSSLTKRL